MVEEQKGKFSTFKFKKFFAVYQMKKLKKSLVKHSVVIGLCSCIVHLNFESDNVAKLFQVQISRSLQSLCSCNNVWSKLYS